MYRSGGASGLVVVAFNGWVIALGRDDGARMWMYREQGSTTMRVEVVGDAVYALGNGYLCCLELLSGKPRWRVSALGNTLLVTGDQVFVGGSGEAACYAAATGERQWSDGFSGMGLGEVAIAVDGQAAQGDVHF